MCGIKTVVEKIRRSGTGLKKVFFERKSEEHICTGKKNTNGEDTRKIHNDQNSGKDYSVRYQSHIDHQWSGWDNIMK